MQRYSDLPVQGERHLHPHPLLQDDAAAASCGSRDSRWAKHSAQEGGKGLGEGAPCCGGSWVEEPQMPMDTQNRELCCLGTPGDTSEHQSGLGSVPFSWESIQEEHRHLGTAVHPGCFLEKS